MSLPNFPKEAKPHEVAILLAYSLGYKTPESIAELLHYPTRDSAYRALKKYHDILPDLKVVAHKQRLIGTSLRSPL